MEVPIAIVSLGRQPRSDHRGGRSDPWAQARSAERLIAADVHTAGLTFARPAMSSDSCPFPQHLQSLDVVGIGNAIVDVLVADQ